MDSAQLFDVRGQLPPKLAGFGVDQLMVEAGNLTAQVLQQQLTLMFSEFEIHLSILVPPITAATPSVRLIVQGLAQAQTFAQLPGGLARDLDLAAQPGAREVAAGLDRLEKRDWAATNGRQTTMIGISRRGLSSASSVERTTEF